MDTDTPISLYDRITSLLQHLKINSAHFLGCGFEWQDLAEKNSEAFLSLSLVCPWGFDPNKAQALASRLLVIQGDLGLMAERTKRALKDMPKATYIILPGYEGQLWDDIVDDKKDEISSSLLNFLRRIDKQNKAYTPVVEGSGKISGIPYEIQGSGPPIVILPIGLAPSQWESILPMLHEEYCTITLGGSFLGGIGFLEARASEPGYLRVVERVINQKELNDGDELLDVGCGSGTIERWLARYIDKEIKITGVDKNNYVLREARSLAAKEGLERVIKFKEGDAESLPFPDNEFTGTMGFTFLEEANADKSLNEMIRVTKPGGWVSAVVRAQDLPLRLNIPVRAELKSKMEIPMGAGVAPHGCADASLYTKFSQFGLSDIQMLPDSIVFSNHQADVVQGFLGVILGSFTPEEADECRNAIVKAVSEGTFFLAQPVHCAVGTKL